MPKDLAFRQHIAVRFMVSKSTVPLPYSSHVSSPSRPLSTRKRVSQYAAANTLPPFSNPYGLLAVILTRALLTRPILFRPLSIDKPPKAPFAVAAALPDPQVHDLE